MVQRARTALDWLKIYALPIFVILLGVLLSLGSFYWLKTNRDNVIRRNFSILADSKLENLKGKVNSYTSILQLLTDQFRSGPTVTRGDFQSMTSGILKRHDEISSLHWMPFVRKSETDQYMESLKKEGFLKEKIRQVNPFRPGNPEGALSYYLPVTYVVPTLPGRKSDMVALDYLSDSSVHDLLKESAIQNFVVSLPNIASLQALARTTKAQTEGSVLTMLKPVYRGEHLIIVERWKNLAGFVAIQVPHQALFKSVFPPDTGTNLELYVYAKNGSNEQTLLYKNQKSPNDKSTGSIQNWWTYKRKISVGDKQLQILMNPTPSYISKRQTAYPWVVLVLGLAITLFLGRTSYTISGEYLSREKQFYSVFDNAPYAIATIDQNGLIQLWNDTAESMFGYKTAEARGMNFTDLLETEETQPGDFLVDEDSTTQEGFREVKAHNKQGTVFPVNLGMRQWQLQGQAFYTVMAEDITERKKYEKKIERLARRDNLTGLLNRGTFMNKLEEEFDRVERYDQPLSVIMLDVDFFKDINDDHGHLVGDKILEGLADTLENDTRSTDFVGRYGGEEFCVALPETELRKAEDLAERIRKTIKDAEYVDGVTVTCSFGVAEHDGTLNDVDTLLNRADEALYRSKENGRDQTSVWESS
jgi:diguanylate cyclase (GGDEF)-like protein/PAS domain S-box-containing protein